MAVNSSANVGLRGGQTVGVGQESRKVFSSKMHLEGCKELKVRRYIRVCCCAFADLESQECAGKLMDLKLDIRGHVVSQTRGDEVESIGATRHSIRTGRSHHRWRRPRHQLKLR